MKKIYRCFASIVSVAVLGTLALIIHVQSTIPDRFTLIQGQQLELSSIFKISQASSGSIFPPEAYAAAGNSYQVDLKMLGSVNLKTVRVDVVERKMVVPGGNPFGIKMFTEGVIIVGLSDVPSGGVRSNPAKQAGIKLGDILLEIDGTPVTSNTQVGKLVSQSGGKSMELKVRRNDANYTFNMVPIKSDIDAKYRAGIWVRDSSAGIGTMTFYDPDTGIFTGLGHAICDIDTGEVMPLNRGEIVNVNISGVLKGQAGAPGELRGGFINERVLGNLLANTNTGVYGRMNNPQTKTNWNTPIPIAMRYEVEAGPATILTTVSGSAPKEYDIMIEKIDLSDSSPTKNLVIKITDPELIAQTGGIVQGMSGSPIIQNEMLVGSVTHVFVNDPQRGFGIFAENVYNGANTVYFNNKAAS